MTIDAIIYRSAQNGDGKNIAIFGGAAVVEDTRSSSRSISYFEKAALKVVEGSLTSHEVSAVSHVKHEVYTPDPKPNDPKDDANDGIPF